MTHPEAVRAAVLAIILALTALIAGPSRLLLGAPPSDAAIVTGANESERGVLPAKPVLRALSRPRQSNPVADPPPSAMAIAQAGNSWAAPSIANDSDPGAASRRAARLLDCRPRAPPERG
jgi:hypothetical protein